MVTKTNEYYPFGMVFTREGLSTPTSNIPTKHKYNGKEEQEMPGK
jgi:hypothetical protein